MATPAKFDGGAVTFDTTELIAQTAGYTITNGARRALMDGGSFKPRMSCIVTGAVTDAAWQYFGRGMAAKNVSKAAAKNRDRDIQMERALYWAVFAYGLERAQGYPITFLQAAVEGAIAPMLGDQIYGVIDKK